MWERPRKRWDGKNARGPNFWWLEGVEGRRGVARRGALCVGRL